MSELMTKIVDLVATQPSAVMGVVAALSLLLLLATPIASLALAGYVVRAWVRREMSRGEQ
jgi:hypothetical protein